MSRSTHRRSMDYVTLHKRLAIYHRDHFDCVYCAGMFPPDELGYGLQLDHLGDRHDHRPENLVTACGDCNARKQDYTLDGWLALLAREGADVTWVRARVEAAVRKPLDMAEGVRLARIRRPKYTVPKFYTREVQPT